LVIFQSLGFSEEREIIEKQQEKKKVINWLFFKNKKINFKINEFYSTIITLSFYALKITFNRQQNIVKIYGCFLRMSNWLFAGWSKNITQLRWLKKTKKKKGDCILLQLVFRRK